MKWTALGPELIVLMTAFALLILGLFKTYDNRPFLCNGALGGLGIAWLYSALLWRSAPHDHLGAEPEIFSNALIYDRFSQSFNLLILAMGVFAILASYRYPKSDNENKSEYFTLVLMAVAGMMFLAKAGTLITAFVALEVFSIALYILCGFSAKHGTGTEGPGDSEKLTWECKASQESTVKYLLTGAFASAILVYGMALVYVGTGTTEIRGIAKLLHSNPYSHNTLVYIGVGLMFAGLAFKVSAVPFHSWTPDVYQGAPTPITAFMSVATKAAAFALIARVFSVSFHELQYIWMPVVFGVSVITMIVGNTAAIFQTDIKRMLAFSGIAHAGYLLIGIVANSHEGVASILFYLAVYLFMNVGAFAIVLTLEGQGSEGNSILRLKGLSKRNPMLAGAMALFMVSLAGIPPTAGFFGKLYLFLAAIQEGYHLLAILAVIASMIAVYFYLRVIVLMYFHDEESTETIEINKGMRAVIMVSMVAVLVFGLFPSTLMSLAKLSVPF